jgi:hypothetical protein
MESHEVAAHSRYGRTSFAHSHARKMPRLRKAASSLRAFVLIAMSLF